jgi:hypothetical protein
MKDQRRLTRLEEEKFARASAHLSWMLAMSSKAESLKALYISTANMILAVKESRLDL